MSFIKSIQTQSKKYESPFDHWEYNNALSDEAINEINNHTKYLISTLNAGKEYFFMS